MIYKENILELIGNTPLVKLNKINRGLKPQIFAKLESLNPGGSVKDRIGISMIQAAEKDRLLKPGGVIVEATSGNTGIGLALAALLKGYKSIFVVTDKVSNEKINYLKALNSDVVVVPHAAKKDSKDYYLTVAKQITKETPNAVFMYQYTNPANPLVHYHTTGPEIWKDTEGRITHFVSGIGTGGTISGAGRFLKEKNPNIQVIGGDPIGSVFKDVKEAGIMPEGAPYLVEGIGQDYIPENVHLKYIDKVITVSDADSFHYARMLTKEEGIFCGGSTGTILYAAMESAKDLNENDIMVFIVCDTGERYLSKFHNEEWLKENRLLSGEMKTLRDIRSSKSNDTDLVYVQAGDKIKTAVEVLNSKGYSQLPVLENGEPVGSIKEAKLMQSLLKDFNLLDAKVETVMGPSFPVLDERTELSVVKKYLSDSPAVLVSEYGRIVDIITRYDVIEYTKY